VKELQPSALIHHRRAKLERPMQQDQTSHLMAADHSVAFIQALLTVCLDDIVLIVDVLTAVVVNVREKG
jgi:hypothetical protein